MRKLNMLVCALVLAMAAGCITLHQGAPRNSKLRKIEIQKSVFPIRVWSGMGERACSSVYVAPNLLVTTQAVLGDPDMVGKINVDDGVYTNEIGLDSVYLSPQNLVVLKTKKTGKSLSLREKPLKAGQELTYVSRSFRHPKTKMPDGSRKPMWGSVAISRWKTGTAIVQEDVRNGKTVFVVKMPTKNMCGAVLVDSQGKLAGIAYQKEPVNGHALAYSAHKIEKLLDERM